MRSKFIFLLPIVFLSLALTSCTSELGTFLEAINKGLGRTEEVEQKSLIPKDYYTKGGPLKVPNTYANLKKFMRTYVGKKEYEGSIYDCSEMSALLEHDLENKGFEAYIIVGFAPFENPPKNKHAWVFVKTRKGDLYPYWVPIEATRESIYNWEEKSSWTKTFTHIFFAPGIVTSWNPNYLQYFKYDHLYSSIYNIPASQLSEYDWWKS